MPAKTPDDLIQKAISLYRAGNSSTEISNMLNIGASIVSKECRKLGITRTMSEAKKLHFKKNPIPLQVVDRSKIYRASDSEHKQCASCGRTLPATPEFFYKRKRNNGRIYLISDCKECIVSKRRIYRQENPEKIKESSKRSREKNGHLHEKQKALRKLFDPAVNQRIKDKNRAWQAKNKDYMIIYRKAYFQENKERIQQNDKNWKAQNPLRARISRANRKARIKAADGRFSHCDIHQKLETQNGLCFWCGDPLKDSHIDHLVPIAKGGSNFPDNIVMSCPTCNVSRGAKTEEEFREYMKFLDENKEKIAAKREYMRHAMRRHRRKKQDMTTPQTEP